MTSFKKRYDAQQKKKALSLMEEFIKRIRTGEFVVETYGTWMSDEGTHNLKVVVKEKES